MDVNMCYILRRTQIIRFIDRVKDDMGEKGVTNEIIDVDEWKKKTYRAAPN